VLEPKLPILDEPTEGIQPNIVHGIGDIILRLNRETGVTVLLVEQKLPFARRVASEFRVLEKEVAASPAARSASSPTTLFESMSASDDSNVLPLGSSPRRNFHHEDTKKPRSPRRMLLKKSFAVVDVRVDSIRLPALSQ
jgi:ABC-type multidrug transport system ATPase subunit